MVDYLTLALMHGLLALALVRLAWRDDLDGDPPPAPAEPEAAEPARRRTSGRPLG